jgi:hypothetical protein
MNKEILKNVILEQKKFFLNKTGLFSRDILSDFYTKYRQLKEIFLITGIRRCGKSSLLRLIWDDYKSRENLTDDRFLYVNFEDERLADFTKDDFEPLMEVHREINPGVKDKEKFLFFDEIQNIRYWEKFLNRLRESEKYKIYVTGSNASLLSSEMGTALTGRNLPVALYPLSFHEYFTYFKKQTLNPSSFYDHDQRMKIGDIFKEYMQFGGMPEYIKNPSPELTQEYFKDIISRDIVNRYNIKYRQKLSELARLLLANIGQKQSLRNIGRIIEMKNAGTIKNYLKYLEESFLFFRVPLFSYSIGEQIANPAKYYSTDISFYNNIANKVGQNLGWICENIVLGELKRDRQNEVFYCKTKKNLEVDFIAKNRDGIQIYQVSHDLADPKTENREVKALLAAMAEFNLRTGIILNQEIEKTETIDGKQIHYVPLWKWLLKNYSDQN